MQAISVIEGTAVPLDRSDVDTDQIIPAQYLKRIERTGFGPFLFDEWRKDPGFVLNDARYEGASVLIAGANFGSGSSRQARPSSGPRVTSIFIRRSRLATSTEILSPGL